LDYDSVLGITLCSRRPGFPTPTPLTLGFSSREHGIEVLSDILTEQFEDVGLVGGGVAVDFWGEGEGDDAGDAGAEFEDGRVGL